MTNLWGFNIVTHPSVPQGWMFFVDNKLNVLGGIRVGD